jgi:NAD(P)H-dependent flavin oxidoreductase YrpB (nitropropane dioxygenase family)
MSTKLAKELGLEIPLFAFTRSKEVVVEVSRAGGMGVLGAIAHSPEQLDEDLAWIDAHVDGKPYGVDTVMPNSYLGKGETVTKEMLQGMIPQTHRDFVDKILAENGIPPLPDDYQRHEDLLGWSVEKGLAHIEVSLKYPIKLIANALGTPPAAAIERAHEHGVLMAALCGKKKQALAHKAAGIDVIVAQGTEAGGHTGEIAGTVLTPEIVDAVGDTHVLMAGGIGGGRQLAAAIALGAQGGWAGSIWLTTEENQAYQNAAITEMLLAAGSGDTMRSRCISGKPARQLVTEWVKLWEGKESPGTLPIPLQWMVQAEACERIFEAGVGPLMTCPVGQVVGHMDKVVPTAAVMQRFKDEYAAAVARLV